MRRNLKISAGFRPWRFKDRPPVEPEVAAFCTAPPEGWTVLATVDTLTIAAPPPGNEYAAVTGADGMRSVCTATGLGGDMRIICDSPGGGTSSVKEYTWPGWQARVNGAPAVLLEGPWLNTVVPPGKVEVILRYRPWNAPPGIALCIVGLAISVWMWRSERQNPPLDPEPLVASKEE